MVSLFLESFTWRENSIFGFMTLTKTSHVLVWDKLSLCAFIINQTTSMSKVKKWINIYACKGKPLDKFRKGHMLCIIEGNFVVINGYENFKWKLYTYVYLMGKGSLKVYSCNGEYNQKIKRIVLELLHLIYRQTLWSMAYIARTFKKNPMWTYEHMSNCDV